MKLHLDVIIPGTDRERARAALLKLAEIYNNYGILPNLPLAAGRITMINGFRDMTMYGNYVHDRKEQLKGWVKSFYGDSSLGIAEITYAEVCYQRDECFEAITTLVGIIPFIEKEGEIAVLFIALSLQMRIMIATGQIAVVYPILEEIYQRLHKEQSRWLLENFGAMKAWGLLYDGDVDAVTEWMENEAPSEFGELNMLDTYKYMIKMRAYILEEKYLAMLSLAEYLREPLRKGDRVMDLCEMNLLCAVSYFLSGRKEDAFQLIDELLPIVKERRFDRLIADERSNQEIADFMGISINTVKFHGKNIFAKLRVRTRRQAARMRTAAYKVDVASDRRRRGNVPRHILFSQFVMQVLQAARHLNCRRQILQAASFQRNISILIYASFISHKFTFFLQKLLQNMIESFFHTYYAENRRKQKNTAYIAGRKYSAIYLCTLLFWNSGI